MKNITKQLADALNLLTDYPGIEDQLDIEGAKVFLTLLSTSSIATVPDFKELDADKINELIKISKNSVPDWVVGLEQINGVYSVYEVEDGEEELITGLICRNLHSLESAEDTRDDDIYFEFNNNDHAIFNALSDKGISGTWKEVYIMIINYSNEHLRVPDLPS